MSSGASDLYERYTRACGVEHGQRSASVMTREEFAEALEAARTRIDDHLRRATFAVSLNRLSRGLGVPEVLVRVIFEANPHELVIMTEGAQ